MKIKEVKDYDDYGLSTEYTIRKINVDHVVSETEDRYQEEVLVGYEERFHKILITQIVMKEKVPQYEWRTYPRYVVRMVNGDTLYLDESVHGCDGD